METEIYWPRLCGNTSQYDAFWSTNLTLETFSPDFSNCFQETILTWIPAAYMLIAGLVYIPFLSYKPTVHRLGYISKLCLLKMIAGVLLIAVSLVDLFYSISTVFDNDGGTSSNPVILQASAFRTLTMLMATFLTYHSFRKKVQSSGVLFIFWLMTLALAIIPFRSRILQYQTSFTIYPDEFRFVTFYIYFGLVLAEFIFTLFPDLDALRRPPRAPPTELSEQSTLLGHQNGEPEEEDMPLDLGDKPCPKLTAPFLSQLFFFWFFPTVINGYKRPIEWEDIWDIREEDSCEQIVPRFEENWEKELQQLGKTKKEQYEAYLQINGVKKDTGKNKKMPSLYMALFRTFGLYYFSGGILLLIYDFVSFVNPQILQALITFVETGDPYEWRGWLYGFGMFLFTLLAVLFIHHFFNIAYTTGMHIRTATTALIYRKALRLSPVAKKTSTTGEIVNLMSVDTQKLQDAPNFINYVWSSPIMVALAMYFLWQILGISCLTGLAFMLVVLPVNSLFMAMKIRELQKSQMKLKDERIKLMNQVLSGVKVLKLYAWEPFFRDKILAIREKELKNIKYGAILGALTYIIWFCSPFLVALLCFTTYVLSDPDNNILDAQTAFVSMSLINLMNFPLTILPISIMFLVQAIVSIKRIEKFLLAEEIDVTNVQKDISKNGAIVIEDGQFSWGEEDRMTLSDINVKIKHGKLVAVVGTVGCGKSSLISAMLGEMMKHEGTVTVNGGIAYIPQQAWIQNLTVRDNIMFARAYHESEYNKVLDACALGPDLKILPGGDLTEIGERGINLSGGQKQRVSLARAVYQNADIYLLDDPLSAVDAHVGKHIFDKVVGPNGLLKDKTRVLVTNGISYLPEVDEILVVKDGTISERGSYEELLSHNGPFADFIRTYLRESDGTDNEENAAQIVHELQRRISAISGDDSVGTMSGSEVGSQRLRRRKQSRTKSRSSVGGGQAEEDKAALADKERLLKKQHELIAAETVEEGTVKLSVIKAYVKAATTKFAVIMMLSLTLFIGSQCFTNIWLSWWSNDRPVNGTQDRDLLNLRLGVYGALGAAQTFSVLGLATAIALGSVCASRSLHSDILFNILKCPMSFFDTTPLGRIVNRFSKDVDIVDANIPQFTQNLMTTLAPLTSTIIVIIYSTPIFVVVVIPLAIAFAVLQRVYVACARQIKRVDSIKRSPIYAFFSETLNGVGSIRAYGQQDRFIQHADGLLDDSQRVWFEVFTSNRWIGILAEFIGDIVVLFAAIFAVLQRDSLNPGLVGLSLSFALQVSMNLIMTVRSSCELETYIVAVERIKEYADAPTEADWIIPEKRPPREWPREGGVEFKQYSTKYREGLELVLKGVTCFINPSEKVGIVGRTGAGKSSMTLALFRIIEATGGSIEIDGVDLANMGLHDARGRLTIIPQDPVLFSGSLRFNIDPSDKYADDEIWNALEQAHLKNFIQSLPDMIQYECGEDGENLSVGQRQLVCLARALLRKSKILVLDEATAAVDLETDDLIQSTIRSEFKECTVITIAHRINTIMDYDRVMVMDAGQIVEFDKPDDLLKSKTSRFYAMAKDAGLA